MNTHTANERLVGTWIATSAARTPDKVAIEFVGETTTYRELDEASSELAKRLLASGLVPGDRVATLSENRPEQVVLVFACAKAGLILAPLNWHLALSELDVLLRLVEPAALWLSRERIEQFGNDPVLGTYSPRCFETIADELADGRGVELPEIDPSDGLLLIATSGTTGTPKGALLSHANCYWTNRSLDEVLAIDAEDVVLQVLPQYHVGGWNVQPLLAWRKGATVVLEPTFESARALELLAERRVTTMMGVPTNYLRLAHEPNFAVADLSHLRSIVVGGAAMPRTLADQWFARGVAVAQGYGLTEAAPNVCCLVPDELASHPGYVGRPYPYVEVSLRTDGGEDVVGAGRGEMWVRGPNVFAGYWRNADATNDVVRDGWLRTGDIAERDVYGNYQICGRTKEMFVSGGENVYPVEVERVLTNYANVADAAVLGVPDERWGERGVAFVVARQGVELDVDELRRHLRTHLAAFKVPKTILVVDELPRTHLGKVDKMTLGAKHLAEVGALY